LRSFYPPPTVSGGDIRANGSEYMVLANRSVHHKIRLYLSNRRRQREKSIMTSSTSIEHEPVCGNLDARRPTIHATQNTRTSQPRSDVCGVFARPASFSMASLAFVDWQQSSERLLTLRSRRAGLSCLPCSIPCRLSQAACHRA
jgi:hypothetical protein